MVASVSERPPLPSPPKSSSDMWDHEKRQRLALLLAELLKCPDEGLTSFGGTAAGRGQPDRVEHLRRARQILEALGDAVEADDAQGRQWVTGVWRGLGPRAGAEPRVVVKPSPSTAELTFPASFGRKKQVTTPFHRDGPAAAPPPSALGGEADVNRPSAGATIPTDRPELPGPGFAPPELTLEQYAWLCAETAVFPDLAQEANRKYGVADERARGALDRQWRERFTAEPALRTAWKELLTRCKSWLREQQAK